MSASPNAPSPLMVGRDRELVALGSAAEARPGVALVLGEPGIGKTRLVHEFLRERDGHDLVLFGRCRQMRDPFPLGPIIESLRDAGSRVTPAALTALAGSLRALVPELSSILPPEPEPLGDPAAERHRVFRGIREVLGALGEAILVIEDAHWADDRTWEFLSWLAGDLPSGCLLVVTSRNAEMEDGRRGTTLARSCPSAALLRLQLTPLDEGEVGALVAAMLGADAVSSGFAAALREWTGGVPFAVEEVLRLLVERRDIVQREGAWTRSLLSDLQVPPALAESIQERMSRLPAGARDLLAACSILQDPADASLLEAMTGLRPEGLHDAWFDALRSELVQEEREGTIVFRHALARQAVREAIPAPLLRSLHQQAAAHLMERNPVPTAAAARHSRAAGDTRAWIRLAGEEADLAVERGEHRHACVIYRQLLECPDLAPGERTRVLLKYGRAAVHGLAQEEAIDVLRSFLGEGPVPPDVAGELRFILGRLLIQGGSSSDGLAELKLALKELPAGFRSLRVRTMLILAMPISVEGTREEHLEWLAGAWKEIEGLEDPSLALMTSVDSATLLTAFGHPGWAEAAAALPIEARTRVDRQTLERGFLNLGYAHAYVGHAADAAFWLGAAKRLGRGQAYGRLGPYERAGEVVLAWLTGRWDGLLEQAEEVASIDTAPHATIVPEAVLGLLKARLGAIDDAEEILASVARRSVVMLDMWTMGASAAGIGACRLERDDPAGALEAVREAVDVISRKGMWSWAADCLPMAVEARIRMGELDAARALARRFREGLRGLHAPAAIAASSDVAALIAEASGNRSRASRTWEKSERLWSLLPRPYQAARAAEQHGVLARDGDGDGDGGGDGSEHLLRALDGFEKLGASRDANRVRRYLRDRGVALPHRRGRRGYGNQVSPREAEVARLAAIGRSNREIAKELYLAERTVEDHLARARRKLGARSRRELAGLLPRGEGGPRSD